MYRFCSYGIKIYFTQLPFWERKKTSTLLWRKRLSWLWKWNWKPDTFTNIEMWKFCETKNKKYIFLQIHQQSNSLYILHYIHCKDICHWTKIILESSIRLKGELCAQTDEFNLFWLVKQIITIYIYSQWDIYYMNPYNGPIQKCNSVMGRLLHMLQCLWLVNSNLIRCYICYSVYDW